MNPVIKFKQWIVGDMLSKADDAFAKSRIDVIFNFTFFFLLTNIPYTFIAFSLSVVHAFLAILANVAFISVFIILKKTQNITWAIYFYIFNHTIQNLGHYIINNGLIEAQGVLFFTLGALFTYLMIGKKSGLGYTIFTVCLICVGIYNENSGFSLFHVPASYADPMANPDFHFMLIIPVLLNINLVHEFVKARQKAEELIQEQKENIELKNKDITDSINYAKKIQTAVLPNEETINKCIPLSFILFKPKDIVSGDFFWFHEIDSSNYIIVCADCTGHGVPGAFMTVIGSSLLNQIIIENKIAQPAAILDQLDKQIGITLKQERERTQSVQDGMDLSLLKVDKANSEFTFTSAKRPAVFIRDKQSREIKGSKFALGGMQIGEKIFEEIKMNYTSGDLLYFFTDGITDQFGGEKGKKFMTKRLVETLLNIHQLPMADQQKKLNKVIEDWKGPLEQVDDILLIGIKF